MSDPATSPIRSDAAGTRSNENVRQAIAQAARSTGVDFGFLLAQAKVESGLDPQAHAKTSTASGLYQFINSTWLSMAERHGTSLGFAGALDLSDPVSRNAVLELRNDPQIASQMAAVLAAENSAALTPVLGRVPDAGELYLAHFLGSGEAVRFLTKLESDPDAPAAPIFAKQAAANRSIFFGADGSTRSLNEVMTVLRGKIEAEMSGEQAPQWAGGPAVSRYSAALVRGFTASGSSFSGSIPASIEKHDLPPLSRVLESHFGLTRLPANSGSIGDHARRAYDRLKGFGL